MGKVRRVMRCYHCGAVLQTKHKKERGYIEANMFNPEEATERVLYCNNCYEKMKAINTGLLEQDADDEVVKILKDAVATDALIIWVVDLFSFNGTLNPDIVKMVKKLNVIVVGTKLDLLPKTINQDRLIQYLGERFEEVGIKPALIRLYGNTDSIDGEYLLSRLHELRRGHDVYMIGSMISGKTSIINKVLKSFVNKSKRVIRTELYPGTSVKVLEIPLTNSAFFYELPGFSLVNSVYGKVEKDIQKMVIPTRPVRPIIRLLQVGDSIMIGALAAIMLEKGKPTFFRLYASDKVETKKVATKRLEEELNRNLMRRDLRPVSDRFRNFADYDLFEYTMEQDGKLHDIGLSGIGWVTFEAKGQTIRILVPKGTAIKECLSKVK